MDADVDAIEPHIGMQKNPGDILVRAPAKDKG
jgi:hypothetical protein